LPTISRITIGYVGMLAILSPPKNDVIKIRFKLKIPCMVTKYKAIDTVTEENQAVNYPGEFLNSLRPAGMPPQIFTLKIGF